MVARSSLQIALFVLTLILPVRAEWTVTSSETERSAGGIAEHRRVLLGESTTGAEVRLELAIFSNKSANLRLIDNPNRGGNLATAMQREQCLAGVNGGYFDPEYAPVGLLISDGQLIAPLRKARLLSGVVSTSNGRIQIQRPTEFSMKTKPTAARQCGPFLVDRGKAIAGLNDTRAARRTFVATGGGDQALLGYATQVTLAQLGALLATPTLAPDVKIQRALNLDGGSSSAFWFAGEKGAFSIREQKTVRDYLGIVAKPAL